MIAANTLHICRVQSLLFWDKFINRQAKHSSVFSCTLKLSQLKPLAHIFKTAFMYMLVCVYRICATQRLTTVVTLNKDMCTCVPFHNSDYILQLIL